METVLTSVALAGFALQCLDIIQKVKAHLAKVEGNKKSIQILSKRLDFFTSFLRVEANASSHSDEFRNCAERLKGILSRLSELLLDFVKKEGRWSNAFLKYFDLLKFEESIMRFCGELNECAFDIGLITASDNSANLLEEIAAFKQQMESFLVVLLQETETVHGDMKIGFQTLEKKIVDSSQDVKSSMEQLKQMLQNKALEFEQKELEVVVKISNSQILSPDDDHVRNMEVESLKISAADIDIADHQDYTAGSFGFLRRGTYMMSPASFKKIKTEKWFNIEDELLILKKMRSPLILSCFGFCEVDESVFLIFEDVPFGSLFDLLFDRMTFPVFPVELSLGWVRDAANAVQYVHKRGIVHRDINPLNFLVFHDFRIKLFEFGRAKMDESYRKSVFSSVVNNDLYLAPELLEKRKFVKGSDVYSLGLTAVSILKRDYPTMEPADQQINAVCEDVNRRSVAKYSELSFILKKCVAPLKSRASADAVSNDLMHLGFVDPRLDHSNSEFDALRQKLMEYSEQQYRPPRKALKDLNGQEIRNMCRKILNIEIKGTLTGEQLEKIEKPEDFKEIPEFEQLHFLVLRELLAQLHFFRGSGVPFDVIKNA